MATSKTKTSPAATRSAKAAAAKTAASTAAKKKAPAKKAKTSTRHVLQTPSVPAPAPAPAATPAFVTTDPAAAYAHFAPIAASIPAAKATVLNISADLVVHNVGIAMAAFATLMAAVIAAVPTAPIQDFLELPALALALLYGADQVVGTSSSGLIAQKLKAVSALRTPMLAQLEIFASLAVGLADAATVQEMREGKGPLDKAHDAVNVSAYFVRLGAAIAGKHPFTAAQIAQLASDGQWLVAALTPTGAAPAPTAADPAATLRDQLWTLINTRYDAMRAATSVVVGLNSIAEYMPALNTRAATVKKAAATPATPPAATPATPATPATR